MCSRVADGKRGELSLQPGVMRKRRRLSVLQHKLWRPPRGRLHVLASALHVLVSGCFWCIQSCNREISQSDREIHFASTFLTVDLDRDTDERKAVVVTQACGSQMLRLGKSRPEIAWPQVARW